MPYEYTYYIVIPFAHVMLLKFETLLCTRIPFIAASSRALEMHFDAHSMIDVLPMRFGSIVL